MAIESCGFIGGPEVRSFEEEFAAAIGALASWSQRDTSIVPEGERQRLEFWAANLQDLDAECSPTKVCRNMKDVTFDGYADEGGDVKAAWRNTLAQEGKLGGSSLADLVTLDRALERLAAMNERQARVVECRVFAGMSVEETAEALGVSPATVKRDWTVARAWLNHRLSETAEP